MLKEFLPIRIHTSNRGHTFISIINKPQCHVTVSGSYEEPKEPFLINEYVPKVFRQTYGRNPRVCSYYKRSIHPLHEISLFNLDITDRYCSVSNLSVPIQREGLADEFAYLSVFDGSCWRVLDFGEIKKDKAFFEKVGRGNIYLIQGYDGESLTPITSPFMLRKNGRIDYIEADTASKQPLRLWRKFPTTDMLDYFRYIAGGEIHASNSADFSTFEKICDLESPGSYEPISSDKAYRYWRFFSSKPNSWCNIAEIQFLPSYPMKRIISNIKESYPGEFGIEKAFDGDWLTNCVGTTECDSWVGADFGVPVRIDSVLSVPRSDDNNIHMGDNYELMGWIGGEWILLGAQIARNSPLVFDSIPENTLLWLRNRTRGIQERIFLYENGKQVFW